MQSIQSEPCLYSALAEDPDLAHQVERFVGYLPERVELLHVSAENQDWKTLGQTAHQLRGSGNSYGFEELAICAAQLEEACETTRQESQILASLEELLEICQQVRAGTPGQ